MSETYLEQKRREYRTTVEAQVGTESRYLNMLQKDLDEQRRDVKAKWKEAREQKKVLAEKQALLTAIIDGTWQPEPQKEFEFQA